MNVIRFLTAKTKMQTKGQQNSYSMVIFQPWWDRIKRTKRVESQSCAIPPVHISPKPATNTQASPGVMRSNPLFRWDDQPHQDVNQNARHTAWNQGDQESQAEPERADPEEIGQASTNSGNHPVAA
jgi:hypothetical protein